MTNEINLWFLSRIQTFAKELVETILEADALIVNAKPTTLAISSASSSKLKGFVTISFDKIVKGELNVKSPNYNRGYALKLSIDPESPIKLPQIKMAKNCLGRALHLARVLDQTQIHVLMNLIQQAQSSLATQDLKTMFPFIHLPTFHEASLDCAVDFGIQDIHLVTTLTCLGLPDSNPIEHALSQLKYIQTVKVQGKNTQVIDKIVVETVVPLLVDLKECFGRMEALCLDMGRKYKDLL